MRTTVAHGHAETLRAAEYDVRAHLARGFQHDETHDICGHHCDGASVMQGSDRGSKVPHLAIGARVLENCTEDFVLCQLCDIRNDQFKTETLGTCFQHVDGLGETVAVHEEGIGIAAAYAFRQRHGFCRCGGLVQERRIGQVHAAQVKNHLLECQKTLQSSLRHFGLIGRIGRIPARILEDIAQNHVRRQRVVIAQADERARRRILTHHGLEPREHGGFRGRFAQCERALECDGIGHRLLDQLGQRAKLQLGKHRVNVIFVRADMAADEFFCVLQARERARG